MSRERSSPGQLLGFLDIQQSEDASGYIGSALVTDKQGYPLEFRVLTPVKPTPLQRALIGAGLERYVGVELCGRQLIRGIQRKPHLLLVERRDLLSLDDEFPNDILYVRRAGDQVAVRAKGEPASQEGRLESPALGFQPVVWEGSLRAGDNRKETVALLSSCFEHFDPIEVFTRMRDAVRLLAKQDARYR
ncbi:MAG: hypothetical protein Q8O40_03735 [Chloroflexota bacterium]|nr:hypothetical protein [Chloroflexota bacterium]